MTANTTVINNLNKMALMQTVKIVSSADVVDNFDGTYTYGAISFSSPEVVPSSGDYIVLTNGGQNELMLAADYDDNYDAIGADAGQVTALTNSTGGSTSNTLAAATNINTLTNSTGAAPVTTLAALTNTDALTDSSGGAANTTIAAITQVANAGSADVGPVADGFADIAAQLAKQRTLNNLLMVDVSSLATEVITQKALNTVLINSITSLGAKVNELIAAG